ncbi:carbohydrate kinase family protein [Streptomyces sp. P9(2023)]|uniref:carbohydrate kinase family protein n=1 Tax=Streptomyces sp. P9(2023) TaxID=3064394 RepID=UPI0028F44040|nr:carbohydrate kinase family protein [Streptomyces sp. P9(2023)]MDT9693694.1 carbohydrate kinase family protein [Streptomyces sp. P9(2023)]
MRIAVAGSIATDHLMAYPGRFAEQMIAASLDRVSLSFLADTLEVRRGGVGANIALGLGRLGLSPVLVGAAGVDFAEYARWLRANAVDTSAVHVSETLHTARFVCTTDTEQNQIATFYAGAMAEARQIDLAAVAEQAGGLGLVLVGADDPAAMVRHTETARRLAIPFAADPSQQLARLGRDEIRTVVDGALYLFTNEYEAALLKEHAGWTEAEVLDRVGTWITTRGADGVDLVAKDRPALHVPAVRTDDVVEPTGAGDAFRAGFLAGTSWGWPQERAARLGCAVATLVLEAVGTQEYDLTPAGLLHRIEQAYGADAARAMEPDLARAGTPLAPAV